MIRFLKHLIFIFLFMLIDAGNAQETFIHFNRDISFGKFYASKGSSGTICISNSGGVNPSQNINLLGADAHPASVTISTTSENPIDIKVEARAERLQGQKGNHIALTLNTPDNTFYTIMLGKPAEIYLGGCLEIVSEVTSLPGDFKGIISVDVLILNK